VKKLIVAVLALGSLSFILYSHGSNLFDSEPSQYDELLIGTWKHYGEQNANGASLVFKSTTTYHRNGTENSSSVLHLSSDSHNVSGSSKIKSSAIWKVEGKTIYETKQYIDFYDYSGYEAVRGYFDKLERESKEFLKVTKEYEIRMLTKNELVLVDSNSVLRSYKRDKN